MSGLDGALTAAPSRPGGRPAFEQRVADYQDEFVMREDETLDILQRFDEQAELTLRQLRDADLDTPCRCRPTRRGSPMT